MALRAAEKLGKDLRGASVFTLLEPNALSFYAMKRYGIKTCHVAVPSQLAQMMTKTEKWGVDAKPAGYNKLSIPTPTLEEVEVARSRIQALWKQGSALTNPVRDCTPDGNNEEPAETEEDIKGDTSGVALPLKRISVGLARREVTDLVFNEEIGEVLHHGVM